MAKLDPIRIPMRVCPEGDPVDQTTARINALNETLRAISTSASDPMLQSQAERNERKLLRRSIYDELGRLVGPEETVTVRNEVWRRTEPLGGVPQA